MSDFARITARRPQPFDVGGDTSASAARAGQRGRTRLGGAQGKNGVVLAQVSTMLVPNSGFLFTLFDFHASVGAPAPPEGVLTKEADNPSGLPQNDFRVQVPLTFGPVLPRRVVCRLPGAQGRRRRHAVGHRAGRLLWRRQPMAAAVYRQPAQHQRSGSDPGSARSCGCRSPDLK